MSLLLTLNILHFFQLFLLLTLNTKLFAENNFTQNVLEFALPICFECTEINLFRYMQTNWSFQLRPSGLQLPMHPSSTP